MTTTTTTSSSSSSVNDNDNNDDEEKEKEKEKEKDCSPPSILDYPRDIFTQRQRRFGAVLFHAAFVAYLFVAITRVCDNYFLSSLECISERLNLDQDVAGATFMAAGSSAPEVFISLIGRLFFYFFISLFISISISRSLFISIICFVILLIFFVNLYLYFFA